MVGHQHPAPHRHAMGRAVMPQEIAVSRVVAAIKKRLLPTVPSLGHMVGNARKYEASKAGQDSNALMPAE